MKIKLNVSATAAVAQRVIALAPQTDRLVFESQPRQKQVVETGSGTAKRSAIGVSVTGPS